MTGRRLGSSLRPVLLGVFPSPGLDRLDTSVLPTTRRKSFGYEGRHATKKPARISTADKYAAGTLSPFEF